MVAVIAGATAVGLATASPLGAIAGFIGGYLLGGQLVRK